MDVWAKQGHVTQILATKKKPPMKFFEGESHIFILKGMEDSHVMW